MPNHDPEGATLPDNHDELGPVVIGARDIYDATVQTQRTVERVEVTVTRVADDIAELRATDKDHELRLRSLEGRRWPLGVVSAVAGLIVALMAVLGFLVSVLVRH